MHRERYSSPSRILLPIFLLILSITFAPVQEALAGQESTDSLGVYINQANSKWANGESDLKLSVDLLSEVSKREAQRFYNLATDFYFWSLQKADFEAEEDAITDELQRIKVLVPDTTWKQWEKLYENNDRQLFKKIIGFWKVSDPYSSTRENERLIEHWQRIHYARENFTISKEPPYGTDERGVYYVRLGSPTRTVEKNLNLDYVVGPEGELFDFELGNVVRSTIEVWFYETDDSDFFLMFGERNGWGEYGLRKTPAELIPTDMQVQLSGSGYRSQAVMNDLSKNVALYGLYQQLAPLHDHFSTMFSNMQTMLSAYTIGYSPTNKFIQASFNTEALTKMKVQENLNIAPASKTTAIPDKARMATQREIYRLLSENNKEQYILALKSNPRSENLVNEESLFLSNKISVYDEYWNEVAQIEEPKKVTQDLLSKPQMYLLEEPLNNYSAYFSSELIDTTYNGLYIPGKITQKSSAIVSATGNEKLTWPAPLDKQEPLLISDIILGLDQEFDDARVPITPTLDRIFKPGTDLMVYFETYNIPDEGYSFTYYFEKHRWLFQNKRPSDKPSVTIVNDKLNSDRNTQLFTLSLSDLGEGTYDLIFEFSPVGREETEQVYRTRKIELVVKE